MGLGKMVLQLIFGYHGGDMRCEDGVIAKETLMPAPGMHTLIAKGFEKLASSNIRELKQVKIMLVGMVNAGKSSFLNVLLGLDKEIHFPTNESSWTKIITKLKYGPTKKWCLRTTDEREQCVTEQCDFDPTDASRRSRTLNTLCAYGRKKVLQPT